MSVTVIHHSTQIANKIYHDDGWEFISEWDGWLPKWAKGRLPYSEKRMLAKYRSRSKYGWRIEKGDQYVRQFNEYDGDTYTFRMKKDLYDFACKYDLFPDL